MAKTNIVFNNNNYSIDESLLSSFASALQSHLSTTMNGTGATITLGGTSYNVDSAKLAAATNAFVSHLGTVAGSGYKVVVNGVEYGVDSDKMAGAVSELQNVLGGLQSGGDNDSGSTETVILAEQMFSGLTTGEAVTQTAIPLVVGETYTVKWDGVVYECVGQDMSAIVGDGAVAIGNLAGEGDGLVGNDEPFNIVYAPASLTGNIDIISPVCCADDCDSDTHTVAIYKVNT